MNNPPLKVLLIAVNARFSHSSLAVRYLRRYLELQAPELAQSLSFLEFNINQPTEEILGQIAAVNAELYLFSSYIWNIEQNHLLAESLRQIRPDALIGMGGPEVSYTVAEEFKAHPSVDLILRKEGELPLLSLLRALNQAPLSRCGPRPSAAQAKFLMDFLRERVDGLPGVSLRAESGSASLDGPDAEPPPLSTLPFPYQKGLRGLENRTLYYESSRGCPFHCIYCLSAREASFRSRDLALVFDELRFFMEEEVRLVKFIDRSFNADRLRARVIWRFLIDEGKARLRAGLTPVHWHFEIEASLLEEEDFVLLAEAGEGWFQFEIGIQSFHPEVLKAVRRNPETARIVEALRRLRRDGRVHCHADLIFGLPGEDFLSCRHSFNQALACDVDVLQLGFLKILKGSEMAETVVKLNYRWRAEAPYELLSSDALCYDEIWRLKKLAKVFDKVYNSGDFRDSLAVLLPCFPDAFALFDELRQFMEERDMLFRPLAKDSLFDCLQAFAQTLPEEIQRSLEATIEADSLRPRAKNRKGKAFRRDGMRRSQESEL